MAYRLDIKRILSMNFFHDLPQIMLGCALAAIATDLFLIPNGLAAGAGLYIGCDLFLSLIHI